MPKKLPPNSKEELIERLRELKEKGWIQTRQQVNDGLVGNTLEDILGIEENNITLPDAGKYEIKAQRVDGSLTTLLHFDPYPRKPNAIIDLLGPIYGWPHKNYIGEWSFRITMYANDYTNRGFKVTLDEKNNKLWVEFNPNKVAPSKREWLSDVLKRGGQKLDPKPYWPLREIEERVKEKISNTIYVHAETRKRGDFEEFRYDEATLYEDVDFEKFKRELVNGKVFVDFDARTGHNHGTKFRVRRETIHQFYARKERII